MIAICLQTGSNGNCFYVEDDGVGLLFDAGISGKQAQQRLAAAGRDIHACRGLLISHDHSDHCGKCGIYQRKFDLPLYVTPRTLAAASGRNQLGALGTVHHFQAGQTLRFEHIEVHTFHTPHDAAEGVCFVVEARGRRLGILTDLGHVFAGLDEILVTLDGVFLESNYDPHMLATGPYPQFLKERVAGPNGHIANEDAAGLLARSGLRLQWACLSHLSEQNNTPELAIRTARGIVGTQLPLLAGSRYAASGVLEL